MDGYARVVREVALSGARECTHPWNPAPGENRPFVQSLYRFAKT